MKSKLGLCRVAEFSSPEIFDYIEYKKIHLKLLKRKKAEYNERMFNMLTVSKCSRSFWESVNRFRFKPALKNSIDLESWYNYFDVLFSPRVPSFYETKKLRLSNNFLDERIHKDEILAALVKSKNNKTPGPDEIPYEFLKNLPDNWIVYLEKLFNRVMESEEIPRLWSQTNTVMIFKKGDRFIHSNYWPIALLNCLLKLFTQILSRRVTNWIENEKLIPESQAGFREGRGCIDHIFTLNAMIQNRLSMEKGKLFVLFVDLKAAFPSLSHELIWEKLYKLGIGSKIIKILTSLYSKATVSVKGPEGLTKPIQVTKGVLQGETLSPTIFNLFTADLEEFLIKGGVRGVSIDSKTEILLLAYADDLAIMADNIVGMMKILKGLFEYAKQNKLIVNIDKTKVVVFQKGGHTHIKRIP